MSHRTAKADYEKLSGGLIFIQEYFSYIEHNHFCEKVITTCLTDKLTECFFGIVTERCPALEATRISSNLPKYWHVMPFLFNVAHIFQPNSWTFKFPSEEQEKNDQRNIRTLQLIVTK